VSATMTERPDVEAYLAAVRDELADLRPEERDDLLGEVEASLLDAAEESDAPIAARLGPPADFAAELRAAAGLGSGTRVAPSTSRLVVNAWRSPHLAMPKRRLRELAPIWWVARAYVVVAGLVWLTDSDQSITPPDIVRRGPGDAGLALLLLAVVLSVGLGLWRSRPRGLAPFATALNVLLLLAAVPTVGNLYDWLSRPVSFVPAEETFATAGLARDGVPIQNIYPFSRDGRLLLDVVLYDQNGAPLDVRPGADPAGDPDRRVLRTRSGVELFNSFPIRYFEAGTRRVARPGLSPRIAWSPIVTPPLERKAR
jgi:hypothetical protein